MLSGSTAVSRDAIYSLQCEAFVVLVVQFQSHVLLLTNLWTATCLILYPSPSPGVCPSLHPLNWWCHPTISSSSSAFSLSKNQGVFQWRAFPFSRGASQSRDQTQVSCIAGRFFTSWAAREALQWVSCLHRVVKTLELQLQHHCFQCVFRVDFL